MNEPTKLRLARILREEGLADMAARAERGEYDDYESDSPTPIMNLVRDLVNECRPDLARRAKAGEWDGTKEEADAWYARDGHKLMEEK